MSPDPNERVAPVAPADRTDEQVELLAPLGGDDALAIFATLAHHPGLLRRWLPFGGKLLGGGKLPARDRELVILRAAHRCGADYEWGQHVGLAVDAGVSRDEVRRVADPGVVGWSEREAALLVAVDDVVAEHRMTDETWASLARHYDTPQLIEIPMLAGHYAMLAGVLGSLGVRPEPGLPGLGEA